VTNALSRIKLSGVPGRSRCSIVILRIVVIAVSAAAVLPEMVVNADERLINVDRSAVTVRLTTHGLGSASPEAHVVHVPMAEGSVEYAATPHVQMLFDPARLRIQNSGLSKEKSDVVKRFLLGPDVLNGSRFSRITFHSLSMERQPAGWLVHGELELRGQFYALPVHVVEEDGRYQGVVRLRLSTFGIPPTGQRAGIVTLDDEVAVDFDIVVER
jgi:polyisoprenoid-binding protein YceI